MTRSGTLLPKLAFHRRRFAQAALPAALAAVFSCAALPVAHAQDYAVSVTDLQPAGDGSSIGTGIFHGVQVGDGAGSYFSHALLWRGTAGSVVDLNPTGFRTSHALGVFGGSQVGYASSPTTGSYEDGDDVYRAFLWQGTAESAVNLHPDGFDESQAYAVAGDTQVGTAFSVRIIDEDGDPFVEYEDFHAFLWHGSADSAVDLTPDGFSDALAVGVSGGSQVGEGLPETSNGFHALLWHGTAGSAVDLGTGGFNNALALGVSGNTQVGRGYNAGFNQPDHALLWHSAATGVIDLTPPGFIGAQALAVSGLTQVGSGITSSGQPHALLWRGTARSALDLNPFLPAAFRNNSVANGVDDHDGVVYVVGTSQGSNSPDHAFVWRVVFAPTLTGISPTTRAAGAGAFVLTAAGMRFTHQSFLRWNGKRLPTTFRNSERLQAAVPASLVAQAGTARVTVSTPGVDTSRGQALTIQP